MRIRKCIEVTIEDLVDYVSEIRRELGVQGDLEISVGHKTYAHLCTEIGTKYLNHSVRDDYLRNLSVVLGGIPCRISPSISVRRMAVIYKDEDILDILGVLLEED